MPCADEVTNMDFDTKPKNLRNVQACQDFSGIHALNLQEFLKYLFFKNIKHLYYLEKY